MRLRANAEGEARRELDRTRASLEAKVRLPGCGCLCSGPCGGMGHRQLFKVKVHFQQHWLSHVHVRRHRQERAEDAYSSRSR